MSESFYAIRRADRELMGYDYLWVAAKGPDDWEGAETDADGLDEEVEYEMVLMTVTPVAKKSFGEPFDWEPIKTDVSDTPWNDEMEYVDLGGGMVVPVSELLEDDEP